MYITMNTGQDARRIYDLISKQTRKQKKLRNSHIERSDQVYYIVFKIFQGPPHRNMLPCPTNNVKNSVI